MSDSLREAHRKRILEEADKLKVIFKEKLGKDCPDGFFKEVNQFVEYVYQRDSLEEKIEKLTQEVRSEKLKVSIMGIAISVTLPLVGFILFAL